MVGAPRKSRSGKWKLSVFCWNDPLLARRRLQNAKIKELRSKQIVFGTDGLIATDRQAGETFSQPRKKRAHLRIVAPSEEPP